MFNFNLTPTVRNLLLVNVFVYFLQTAFLPELTTLGSLYPLSSPYFFPTQFVTYMFLHGGLGHLFSNMLGLLIFGPMLEERWGARRFLTFWMICGIGAGVLYEGTRHYELYRMEQAQVEFRENPSGGDFVEFYRRHYPEASGYELLATAMQRDPRNQEYIAAANASINDIVRQSRDSKGAGMLGASGALFGIMFAFAYLFPNTEIYRFPIPFPIKAKYLVFFYAVYELYAGIHRTPGDNVAHFAHLAGLLIGFIVLKFWERGRNQFY